MKKLAFIVFLFTTTFGFSQKAKALLDNVAQKVASYDNIYIEFEHKLDNSIADIHQETRGNATLKDKLYQFNYMGIEQLFDGKKVYMIIHEDEEVIVKQPNTEDETTITPSKMLTFYKKGYTYELDILQKVKGRKIQYIKLKPIDGNSELKHVLLGVDSVTKHIYKVIETGLDDTITTITISKFETNQPISNKLFTFDTNKFEEKGYDITEPN